MKRKCDWCKREYEADMRNIKRGWGLCCCKSCAAKKREKFNNNNKFKYFHKVDIYEDDGQHIHDIDDY